MYVVQNDMMYDILKPLKSIFPFNPAHDQAKPLHLKKMFMFLQPTCLTRKKLKM